MNHAQSVEHSRAYRAVMDGDLSALDAMLNDELRRGRIFVAFTSIYATQNTPLIEGALRWLENRPEPHRCDWLPWPRNWVSNRIPLALVHWSFDQSMSGERCENIPSLRDGDVHEMHETWAVNDWSFSNLYFNFTRQWKKESTSDLVVITYRDGNGHHFGFSNEYPKGCPAWSIALDVAHKICEKRKLCMDIGTILHEASRNPHEVSGLAPDIGEGAWYFDFRKWRFYVGVRHRQPTEIFKIISPNGPTVYEFGDLPNYIREYPSAEATRTTFAILTLYR